MKRSYLSFASSLFSSNADYAGHISSRKDLSVTSIFTSCSFNTQGSSGGAIYFHDTSDSLIVSDCLFEKCNSTSGYGGAIYGYNCGKLSVKASCFIACSSPTYYFGGGMCIIGTSAVPEITESSFVSCSSGQDGGGMWLSGVTTTDGTNFPVKKCRFVKCIANGIASWTTSNDADGGGLIFWENYYTLGIANSLFAKCESKKKAGGSFLVINSVYFDHMIRFCFYSENTAPNGRNALIHFNSSSTNLWSIVFFDSFTSDFSLSNSLAQNYAGSVPSKNDWLPNG